LKNLFKVIMNKEELIADYEASFDLYSRAIAELSSLYPHSNELTHRDIGQLCQLAAEEIRSSREALASISKIIEPLNTESGNKTLEALDKSGDGMFNRFDTKDNNLSRLVLACEYLFEDFTIADDCLGLRTWWKNNKHRFK